MRPQRGSAPEDKTPLSFRDAAAWSAWLKEHAGSPAGVWLLLAKKGGARRLLTYADALDTALSWGWIDGQRRANDAHSWLQRFTPRSARSTWSKINRDKATALIASGRMHAPGLAEVARARADGRWDAAYDSPRTATVPEDLQAALDANPRARDFFPMLNGANRYAVLYRVQTAKKPETRARRIEQLVAMLARGATLPPQGKRGSPDPFKPPAAASAGTSPPRRARSPR